jgi:hypothetical protein
LLDLKPSLFSIFSGADEQRLLEASMTYIAGNPIMSDAEFVELKLRLKVPWALLP